MISLENVSIGYLTGDIKDVGLKDLVVNKILGKHKVGFFWAINNVSFKIDEGDLLGIVGSNGAGKSTLLKAITGIMKPTKGRVKVKGSISALLELGSGFDGNLTVKENVYLRGALLGYSKEYIISMYDSIIQFAELSEFENRAFRKLSSGMRSRLAFAIASLVRPDILILDEVLAVGDGAFRKKSEAKMMEIIHGGATTILVSHSLPQIRRMANKVLWLDKGKQIAFGETNEICDRYEEFLDMKS